MDTKQILEQVKKQQRKKKILSEVKRYKKYILKKYPNSILKITGNKKFYIVDSKGYRILKEEYKIPDGDNPYKTWKQTYMMLWSKHIVDRNNRKFSDERIIKYKNKSNRKNLKEK